MDGRAIGALCVSKTFRQLVPVVKGKYENEIVLNTQRHGKLCFNGTTCDARWAVDDDWNVITFLFSQRNREETVQHPWRKEVYFRIGKTYLLSEQPSSRST